MKTKLEELQHLNWREIKERLEEVGYFANKEVCIAIRNAAILNKPLLLEGPAGVGKTQLSKSIAALTDASFIRLQCTPEINENKALYDYNYAKQLLFIQMLKDEIFTEEEKELSLEEKIELLHEKKLFYGEKFLLKRPILEAIQPTEKLQTVLLVDEIDKAENTFEHSLLEVFSDYTISIPEIGTIKAEKEPFTIITSNQNRAIDENFLRRCLHVELDYPTIEEETRIILSKVSCNEKLASEIAKTVQTIRDRRLIKQPSIAETVEWATILSIQLGEEYSEGELKEAMKENVMVLAKHTSDKTMMKEAIMA